MDEGLEAADHRDGAALLTDQPDGFSSLDMLIRWAWLCASCCPYLGIQEVEAELGVETYLG